MQHLGRKWIDNDFSKKLEKHKKQKPHERQKQPKAFKHQQTLELQKFKVEVDAILSHKLKLQKLEFEFFRWRI